MGDFVQFLMSGVTVGAVYALVALGFTMIYNASHVINFAQGEFVMIGGMATYALVAGVIGSGMELVPAMALAVLIATAVGVLLNKLAIEPAQGGSALPLTALLTVVAAFLAARHFLSDGMHPALAVVLGLLVGALVGAVLHGLDRAFGAQRRNADVVSLIIITIGAAIFLRGGVEVLVDRNFHSVPPFTGGAPIRFLGGSMLPQSLWVVGGAAVILAAVAWFFNRTLVGKGVLATAYNRTAAQLVGINTKHVMTLSFGLAALIGALGGVLIAPISQVYSTVGVMLGLKGFSAAIFGGLGSGLGAVLGGLILGVAEQLTAGFISSAYKDAVAFVIILLILLVRPSGLMGARQTERV